MQIIKTAVLAASVAFAGQGYSLDFTHLIGKAFENHASRASKPDKAGWGQSQAIPAMPAATGNFGACRENFANGEPPVVPQAAQRKARALCFDGFAVLHSGTSKTPIYSAEVLNRERINAAKGQKRTNLFFSDARLPSAERATLEDYRGSFMDRGHNTPAGDTASPESMAQSFSLANVMPQSPQNNQKAWSGIEQSTRKYVMRAKGNVYVVTGSVSMPGVCTLLPATVDCTIGNGVVVPSHIFKLIFDPVTNRAWAHWIENSDSARVSAPISYDELVRRTGIEFLPGTHPQS